MAKSSLHRFLRVVANCYGYGFLTIHQETWGNRSFKGPWWRLYVNLDAGCRVSFGDGKSMQLRRDGLYLIAPWLRFVGHLSVPVRHFHTAFQIGGIADTHQPLLFDGICRLAAPAELIQRVKEVASQFNAPSVRRAWLDLQAATICHAALGQMVAEVTDERWGRYQAELQGASEMEPALRQIGKYPGSALRNAELAQLCHMSTDHFIKRFKIIMGNTPAKFISQRRIALAAERLISTDQAIDEIAEDLGFTDRFHFSRVFKEEMDLPPSRYRRVQQELLTPGSPSDG